MLLSAALPYIDYDSGNDKKVGKKGKGSGKNGFFGGSEAVVEDETVNEKVNRLKGNAGGLDGLFKLLGG